MIYSVFRGLSFHPSSSKNETKWAVYKYCKDVILQKVRVLCTKAILTSVVESYVHF